MSDPQHGEVSYLQLPAKDIEKSAAFYREVFGWEFNPGFAQGFDAAGLHGMLDTGVAPAASGGPMLWLFVTDIHAATKRAVEFGGTLVEGVAVADDGPRLQAVVADPAGNHLGIWRNSDEA
jgi:uncharacterized protein